MVSLSGCQPVSAQPVEKQKTNNTKQLHNLITDFRILLSDSSLKVTLSTS
jgi:hypothetical protein